MHACIHTYIHYVHTYIHAYIHTLCYKGLSHYYCRYNCTCLNAKVVDDDKDWPSHVNEFPLERSNRTEFDIEVGGTTVNFRFTLYQRKSN